MSRQFVTVGRKALALAPYISLHKRCNPRKKKKESRCREDIHKSGVAESSSVKPFHPSSFCCRSSGRAAKRTVVSCARNNHLLSPIRVALRSYPVFLVDVFTFAGITTSHRTSLGVLAFCGIGRTEKSKWKLGKTRGIVLTLMPNRPLEIFVFYPVSCKWLVALVSASSLLQYARWIETIQRQHKNLFSLARISASSRFSRGTKIRGIRIFSLFFIPFFFCSI